MVLEKIFLYEKIYSLLDNLLKKFINHWDFQICFLSIRR